MLIRVLDWQNETASFYSRPSDVHVCNFSEPFISFFGQVRELQCPSFNVPGALKH
jgi:hypothetical protein